MVFDLFFYCVTVSENDLLLLGLLKIHSNVGSQAIAGYRQYDLFRGLQRNDRTRNNDIVINV